MKAAYSPFGSPSPGIGPFTRLFSASFDTNEGLKDADCLILWGGVDIHPSFYRQTAHPKTQTKHTSPVGARDLVEWHLLHEANSRGIPIIGVCRGAQLLTVFAGGSLIQHVNGHNCGHVVKTYDGKSYHAPADHHQMMYPDPASHELLAWSGKMSDVYEIGGGLSITSDYLEAGMEPEVVFYPEVKGMAIQPHPEWGPAGTEFNNWLMSEISTRMYKA